MDKAKKLLRRELVENELLERAADLFAERGFNGTTLQAVADTVGLTRAALYHYFDSKEALLTTLVEGITSQRAADLVNIRRDTSLTALAKLERVTRLMSLNVTTHAARFRLLTQSESEMPKELAAKQARGRRDVLTHVTGIFADGVASGEFTNIEPQLAAFALLGMCNWIAYWYKPDGKYSADAIADQFVRIALAAFGPATGVQPARSADVAGTLGELRDGLTRLERLIAPD